MSAPPSFLSPEETELVLAATDRSTSTGRRDYAVLLLLARLGLRAGEGPTSSSSASACDINRDGVVNSLDVQAANSQALEAGPCGPRIYSRMASTTWLTTSE